MNFSDENEFMQESTLHGVSHLRNNKSKVRTAFWLIVTLLSAGYAGFEIFREIKHISSGIEFETTYRLARLDEIHVPTIRCCVTNPLDIFDWKLVSESMAKYNWTIEDTGHLLASYQDFQNLDFSSRNVSIRHVQQLDNISLETFESMHKDICGDGSKFSQIVVSKCSACMKISCPMWETKAKELVSFVRSGDGKCDRPWMNIRTGVINFMREVHGLNLNTSYQPYQLYFDPFVPMTSFPIHLIGGFFIDPILVNKPTMKTIDCYKRICDSKTQEQPCLNYSEVVLQERGIDCFQWEYKASYLPPHSLDASHIFPCQYQKAILMLAYPPFENWQVREHKPLFLWYKTLSNIGGTLSIWTGASVLSILHLFKVFCYVYYKPKCRVGDNQQIANPPV